MHGRNGYGAAVAGSHLRRCSFLPRRRYRRGEEEPRIELLLTDIVMPGGMNGWELAREARGLRPGFQALFTSGFPDVAFESQASSSLVPEGHLLLSQPCRKPELAQKRREALAV